MRLVGRNIVVVGAGKSGVAAANFCASRGASVVLTDHKTPDVNVGARVTREFGGHQDETFRVADLIVLSPGVPPLPQVDAARARGVEITGEIELASRFIEAPIVAITGTNGKSTVTALCGEMAKQTGRPTFVGGNLGTPLITCVDEPESLRNGIVVVELSSFQLETCETLHPRAATILNVTADHMDRYADMDGYIAAKMRVAKNLTVNDTMVLNADAIALPATKTKPLLFSATTSTGDLSGFVDGNHLVLEIPTGEERYPIDDLSLVGRHNWSNALAALLLMRGSGLCNYEQARAGLKAFRALPHRMQFVAERRGVRFFNDSKATNVDSVVAGLDGFPTPFVLIAGGRDKGGSYDPLVRTLAKNRCQGVILIGEATEKIEAALREGMRSRRSRSLQEAVEAATEWAQPGEAVVLSPACASYDMFENYEQRGRVFCAAVEALPT